MARGITALHNLPSVATGPAVGVFRRLKAGVTRLTKKLSPGRKQRKLAVQQRRAVISQLRKNTKRAATTAARKKVVRNLRIRKAVGGAAVAGGFAGIGAGGTILHQRRKKTSKR